MGAGELRTVAGQLRGRLEDVAEARLEAGDWELLQDVVRRAMVALREGDARTLRRASAEVARLLGSRMRRAESEPPDWLEVPPAVREGTNELLDRLVDLAQHEPDQGQERDQEQQREPEGDQAGTPEPPEVPPAH
ncbi:CATRA system-associated protein [Streptomyces sp. NPDC050636]|uniref:CATRA system-associated protein n=1 Tax=Streptomyces sp. NPDC050636 TaxID=3154510 RepID=UPI0034337FB2